MPAATAKQIRDHGFALAGETLPSAHGADLLAELAGLRPAGAGARNLMQHGPGIADFARGWGRRCAASLLGEGAFPVRALFFDKTAARNWPVLWHQDLTIAVRARVDCQGFGPWSVKQGGVPHVQPPVGILENMLTLRLHLDDADARNGALRVLPGSHRSGILSRAAIEQRVAAGRPVVCAARAGDVLLMRPLLLHASRRAEAPRHRRVLHIEYAREPLPAPLQWHTA